MSPIDEMSRIIAKVLSRHPQLYGSIKLNFQAGELRRVNVEYSELPEKLSDK